jgi:hypothetical protein
MITVNGRNLFILNGAGTCGKDTFVDFVREFLTVPCYCISSVTKVKEAALVLGWDGVKDEKGRKFLSDLKDLSTEAYEGPLRYMEACISDQPAVYFFMVREPVEIAKFVGLYPEMKTIHMTRPNNEVVNFNNHADNNAHNYHYDVQVYNDGTLDDLKEKARIFANGYIL